MWRWIERLAWSLTIIASLIFYTRDEARDEALVETKLNILIENDEKRTEYWNRQNEINGRILMYMELDSSQPGSP